MRRDQSTLRPETVHAYARRLLVCELHLRDYKRRVSASCLADLLLLAAGGQTSLSAACARCTGAPSREAARLALHAALPGRPLELLDNLLGLLRHSLPDHLRRRPLVCALDIHARPYYGRPTRGTSRGQEKRSTKKAFAYASLAAYSDGGRFSVGLIQVREHMRLTTIVARLVRQARQAGLSIAYLLLDKEFYSAEVIAWLQQHDVAFLMPMVRKDGPKGNGHFVQLSTEVGWYQLGAGPVGASDGGL
jgi:hypothetical protein